MAEEGPCTTKHCTAILAVFIILGSLGVMFFLCLCQAPVYVVLLRMLESEDKSLGIGLMSFMSRLLGKYSYTTKVNAQNLCCKDCSVFHSLGFFLVGKQNANPVP